VIRAAFVAVVAMDQEPSRRTVQEMARRLCGKALQSRDVLRVLREIRERPVPLPYQASTGPVPPGVLKIGDPVPAWYRASTTSRARADRNGVSKPLPIVQDGLSLLPSVGVTLTPWAKETEKRVTAMFARRIDGLDHRLMYDVGALHIIRFMSKGTKGDEKVKKAAVKMAGRIRNVATAADHPKMNGLTVGEYFGFGAEVWSDAGGADWDYPWAVVTWAEAPERVTT